MTKSLLRVGTPNLPAKPPRGEPPCTNPIVIGSNILGDPGAEVQPGFIGQTFLPRFHTSLTKFEWEDGSESNDPGAVRFSSGTGSFGTWRPQFSTASPRNGTYHIRIVDDVWLSAPIIPIGVRHCEGNQIFSARVDPGNLVDFSAWAKVDSLSGTPFFDLEFNFFTQLGAYISATNWDADLTASYAQYGTNVFAPATSYLVRIEMLTDWRTTPSGTITSDFDDFKLGILP